MSTNKKIELEDEFVTFSKFATGQSIRICADRQYVWLVVEVIRGRLGREDRYRVMSPNAHERIVSDSDIEAESRELRAPKHPCIGDGCALCIEWPV